MVLLGLVPSLWQGLGKAVVNNDPKLLMKKCTIIGDEQDSSSLSCLLLLQGDGGWVVSSRDLASLCHCGVVRVCHR